jgi:hypothetical protein
MAAHLVVSQDPTATGAPGVGPLSGEQQVPLPPGVQVTLGRRPANTVRFDDPDAMGPIFVPQAIAARRALSGPPETRA